MRFPAWITHHWRENGTKLIGFSQASFGALVVADTAIRATGATPLLSPRWLGILITATGLLTAWRGFFNTKRNEVQ